MARKKPEPKLIAVESKPEVKVRFSQSLLIQRSTAGSYLSTERFFVHTREEAKQILDGLTDALARWVPPCD